jgi:hypothetical protein
MVHCARKHSQRPACPSSHRVAPEPDAGTGRTAPAREHRYRGAPWRRRPIPSRNWPRPRLGAAKSALYHTRAIVGLDLRFEQRSRQPPHLDDRNFPESGAHVSELLSISYYLFLSLRALRLIARFQSHVLVQKAFRSRQPGASLSRIIFSSAISDGYPRRRRKYQPRLPLAKRSSAQIAT